MVEGSAALALAGFMQEKQIKKDERNLVLLCGGNFDKNIILSILN